MTEPNDPFTRYAFGYSDQKPPKSFWIMLAIMSLIAIGSIFTGVWK